MSERPIEREIRKEQGILTLSEAAERLGISQKSVYHRINAGELKSVHIGSRHYVSELALEAYIARSEATLHEWQLPTFLTRKEAAQRLKVSESTVDRWIRKGVLTARRWGHTVRIPEEHVRRPKAENTPDA